MTVSDEGAVRRSTRRTAALAEITRRELDANHVHARSLFDRLREPRLTEILEINRPHRPAAAQLACNVLTSPPGHDVWINLLSAERIASTLRFGDETWTADQVVEVVESCWDAVLW